MIIKQCPKCFLHLSPDNFCESPACNSNGREGWCKNCEMKESKKENIIAFIEGLILVAVGFGIVALIVA